MEHYRGLEELLKEGSAKGQLAYAKDCPLSECCTFRIGGPADYAVYPYKEEIFTALLDYLTSKQIRYNVLGNASDILFDDNGYRGVMIFTSGYKDIRTDGANVYAESGASLTRAAAYVQKSGLSGMEFAYGIPGTCGGGVYMNAGAYGGEMKDIVVGSTYYDAASGKTAHLSGSEHDFNYRHSFYSDSNLIILSVEMKLEHDDPEAVLSRMNDFMSRRRALQPLEYPSAGSVFKRCPGYFTAKLIEEAGLKGKCVGGARVSEKHAGFIVNTGNATASDVRKLIEIIKTEIKIKNGLDIECEVKYISE